MCPDPVKELPDPDPDPAGFEKPDPDPDPDPAGQNHRIRPVMISVKCFITKILS